MGSATAPYVSCSMHASTQPLQPSLAPFLSALVASIEELVATGDLRSNSRFGF
jgi:hypothetical protein